MFRVLAVGGSPARPTVTQVLLNEDADTRVSMVETSASARVVVEDEEFDVGVIEAPDDASAIQTLVSILEVAPLLPFVVVTDAETGPPALFDQGAQDHLCRADLTQATLLRSCRHAIVRRAAAARAEAQARRASAGGGSTGEALPEALLLSTPEEPTEGLLSTLARLLESEPLADVTVERLRQETGLGESQLRRARRPVGNVLLYLVKRDLDAEHELISAGFRGASGQAGSLQEVVHTVVRTFANFWRQAPMSVRLAADYTGLDPRLADLRFEHLRRLSDAAVVLLGEHRDEVRQDDPDRALAVAIDQLLAVLDHQRLLGALHPSSAGPDEVIAEFAGRVTFFLSGPPVGSAPATATRPAVDAEAEVVPALLFAESPPEPELVPRPTPEPVAAVPVVAAPPAPEPEPVPEPEPAPIVVEATPPAPEPVPAPAPVVVEAAAPAPEPEPVPEPVTATPAAAAAPDEEERVTAALRRLQQATLAEPAPAPEPDTEPEPVTDPATAAAAAPDEEERVTAALRRLQQATLAEPVTSRPAPREDPFVAAPASAPADAPPAAARAEASSLFSRRASTSSEGAPVFDPRRIVVEENIGKRPPEGEPPSGRSAAPAPLPGRGEVTTPGPATSGRVFSAIPKSDAPTGGSAAPTFDLARIVVEQARASVA